jgi:hypothetical protein
MSLSWRRLSGRHVRNSPLERAGTFPFYTGGRYDQRGDSVDSGSMRWDIVSVSALMIALVSLVLGPVLALVIPGPTGANGPTGSQGPIGSQGSQGPQGPQGPSGTLASGLSTAYVWGYGVVTDCSSFPETTTFEVHYINLGNLTATNVVAQYTVYRLNNPTTTFAGTTSIGIIAPLTTGSVAQSVGVGCAYYGQTVEVSFTWS